MATYYVDSGAGALEMTARTWSLNDRMVPAQTDTTTNHLVAKQWIWECTTSGTSTGTPTWTSSVTDDVTTVTDNGVVWTARAPDNWTHAMPGMYWLAANATTRRAVAGDTVYVKSTHNKNYSADPSIRFPDTKTNDFVYVISVDASLVPTTGGKETVGNNTNFYIGGKIWVYGLQIIAGAGGSVSGTAYVGIGISGTNCHQTWNSCTFGYNNTSPDASIITVQSDYAGGDVQLYDCTFYHSNPGGIPMRIAGSGGVRIINGSCTSNLSLVHMGAVEVRGGTYSDLFLGLGYQSYNARQKIIGSVVTTLGLPSTGSISSGQETELFAVGTSDHTYQYYKASFEGVISDNQTIYLTSGGSVIKDQDGTLVPYSLKMLPTSANIRKGSPLLTPWSNKFISSTGSKTISMKVAYDSASALTDSELFLEIDYFSSSTSPAITTVVSAPLLSGTSTRDVTAAGSNLTDTSEGWTGTSGWSNKKTATLSKTITVNQQGYIRCRIGVGKNVTVYVDQTIGVA